MSKCMRKTWWARPLQNPNILLGSRNTDQAKLKKFPTNSKWCLRSQQVSKQAKCLTCYFTDLQELERPRLFLHSRNNSLVRISTDKEFSNLTLQMNVESKLFARRLKSSLKEKLQNIRMDDQCHNCKLWFWTRLIAWQQMRKPPFVVLLKRMQQLLDSV